MRTAFWFSLPLVALALISCQTAPDTAILVTPGAPGQCSIASEKRFVAGNETVRLGRAQGLPPAANFAVFAAPLAVNTDGAPTSYHPRDFLGTSLAINRIDNGIAISKAGGLTQAEKIAAFERWRDSGWTVPAGHTISWRNVIAPDTNGKPCTFASGPNAGYFGSLTALKNGLSGAAAGECQVANQLDQRVIPAIVLRGNANPLKEFGAKTGDLVLALNPATGRSVAAVIGDTGNGNRIGEGSVALNMALLGRSEQPRTYQDAIRLDTGSSDMVVAVLPATVAYQRTRPYTAENIAQRVEAWALERGYGSTAGLAAAAQACGRGL
ncbi:MULTISPECIES: hypothetical protein [unclassified Bosea (in: a-proteobacteria)]|uniref:hypothetical protein n=1 Tax=unclassified Bosea (in: a-proteobacteria) TaxID=2653178 RepID=UPI000F752EAB|nr:MULTISPECIES: hypothetical protein [unclassified Bosea (in: a-proteobacteria)]AZO80011.1 hypothetical protein BLM15_22275 [Bosea sp. Tri-49]RXT22791.1 hypothetical protein B5U98_09065 [Bosea sp. Tri-39]RXT38260.1 hypothetical protein B5U99_08515 [Bosea sp. Tri-54]